MISWWAFTAAISSFFVAKSQIYSWTSSFSGADATCDQCWLGTPAMDYACSDNEGSWDEGIVQFPDFLPAINSTSGDWAIQQMNVTLWGSFDCLPGTINHTLIRFVLQGTEIGQLNVTDHSWAQVVCLKCPNCMFRQEFTGNLYLDGISLPNYNYGGMNTLQLFVDSNVVCLANITLWVQIANGPFVPVSPLLPDRMTPFAVVAIALGVTLFALVLAVVIFTLYSRCREGGYNSIPDEANNANESDLDYRERIGRGSMGIVYRAYWKGVEVAVKKLPLDFNDPQAVTQVMAEAKLMKQFRHPNILLYMGHCVESNDICIITEYLKRGSLYHTLHKPTIPLSWSRRIAFALDAAKGMQYLHAFEPMVLHRDLKSANLLLDENWKVKVCDFGLSRLVETIASTMTVCGTPCWVAPEVLRNLSYNAKADVYSFGITLWEIATRSHPYEGLPPFRVVFLVGTQGSRPAVPIDCHVGVAALMQRCWAEDPNERPPFHHIVPVLQALLDEQQRLELPDMNDEVDRGLDSGQDDLGDPEPEPLT